MSNHNEELLYAKLVVLTKAIVDNEQKQLAKTLLDDLSEQLEERVGPQGKQGPIGPKGERGEIGPIGFDGEKGDKGDQGLVGPKGDQGEVGPKGDQGEVGPKGDQGEVGPKGDKGDQGLQGLQGEVGPKGDKGDQGLVGPKGDRGDQGLVGPKGDKGDQGLQGEVGPKGDRGDQGLVGPKGDKGDPGNDADVSELKEKVDLFQRDLSTRITQVAQRVTSGGGSGAGSGSYSIMDQRDVQFKQAADIVEGSILSYNVAQNKYVANNTINNIDHISFDTTTSYQVSQGEFAWNSDEETLDLGLNGAILQLGQELHYHVKNNSGSDIPNGSTIRATGTLGNSSRITVDLMINDYSIEPYYYLGVATEDIENGSDGKVTIIGKVRGINTTGTAVGEVWNDGDLLYLHPSIAGAFTTTPPDAPSSHMPVATVIHAASNGSLYSRTPDDPGIHNLHDVYAENVANNDILIYNDANSRWETRPVSSLPTPITTVTSNTTLTTSQTTILTNATSSDVYVTLPPPSTNIGILYNIKKIDSSINNVVIQGANTLHLIDGSETVEINQQYTTITVQSDGSNWWII